jgi:2-polyprenyl-3-methyl-5-hydroxy-6-metoxy-1,4-benzoquinol methylase
LLYSSIDRILCLSVDIHDFILNEYKDVFNIVWLFQVLEHISNLNDLFKRIALLIKNDPTLLLSVTNNIQRLLFMKIGMDEDIQPLHVGR